MPGTCGSMPGTCGSFLTLEYYSGYDSPPLLTILKGVDSRFTKSCKCVFGALQAPCVKSAWKTAVVRVCLSDLKRVAMDRQPLTKTDDLGMTRQSNQPGTFLFKLRETSQDTVANGISPADEQLNAFCYCGTVPR